jgi:hypothetical protein
MTEYDSEGWKLYNESIIDVTNQDIDGKEVQRHRMWVKQIDGKWYYKHTKEVKLLRWIRFEPFDGKGGPMYDYEDERLKEWVRVD